MNVTTSAVKNENRALRIMPNQFDQIYRVLLNLPGLDSQQGLAIGVASCNPKEGASTVALNFGLAYPADSQQKILIIDANLRTPVMHKQFNVPREKGLSDLLHGESTIEETLHILKHEDFLSGVSESEKYRSCEFSFIAAGRTVENPIQLFQSEYFGSLLSKLKEMFQLIVFDTSPLIRYPETSVLVGKLDGLIIVLQHEGTTWEIAQAAIKNLQMNKSRILGAIINKRQFFIPPRIYRLL